MARNTRSEFQRENDLQIIAGMYLRGFSQASIAKKIGVDQTQVSYDIRKLCKRWRESSLVDFNEAKQRELQRVDVLEREYWRAWRESRKQMQRTREASTTGFGANNVEEIIKEDQYGDASMMRGIQWCIEQRCKIFGLYADININWRDEARKEGYDADGLFKQLISAALVRAGGERGISGDEETNDVT